MKNIAIVFLAGFLLAGCAVQEESRPGYEADSKVARDMSYSAEVDYESGSVVLPLEKFFMTREESGREYNANILKTMLCISEEGLPAYWQDYGTPSTQEWERYGRWNLQNAGTYGYAPVPDSIVSAREDEVIWGAKNADTINSPEYETVRDECQKPDAESPINALALEYGAPQQVLEMRAQSYDLMMATSEAQSILEERATCLKSNGFQLEDSESGWLAVSGVSFDQPDEISIKAAIADVQCKQELDLIQRLADIEASFQGPLVEKYQAELTEMRSEIDLRMTNVTTYLSQHAGQGESLE